MPRINRRKSIVTPPRRDKIAPNKRAPMPDDGPTDFTLQRKAEVIGQGTFCAVDDHRVHMTGGAAAQARAEFASSSTIALLLEQGRIIAKQYRAGNEYARLHRLLWGRSTAKQSGLSKVLAQSLPERIEVANRAAREELDDDEHNDWIAEQRVLYERGMYRLCRIAGKGHVERRLIRVTVRVVVIDGQYPSKAGALYRLRIGLNKLADVWGIE